MNKHFILALLTGVLLLLSFSNFAQSPNLGAASTFSVFTAVGAFNNLGPSSIVGDIGTNSGVFSGFPPGVVAGQIHVADATSAQAAADALAAYSFLDGLPCGAVLGTGLGGGQILAPNVYCLGAASTLNGNLILDAGGNQNAVFIFQIDGALSTGINSQVTLVNGASICNVFWQVNGAFSLGAGSAFRGTLIANGAISLLEGSSVVGRALSTAGAVDLHNNAVTIGLPPACAITGSSFFCSGQSTQLCATPGLASYKWSTGAVSQCITVSTAGTYSVTVTNSNGCTSICDKTVSVNPPPVCNITGTPSICGGQPTQLCATPGQSAYLWGNGSTSNCITVNTAGIYSVTITGSNGCTSSCSQTVSVNTPPVCNITGTPSICGGQPTQLCATPGQSAYLWGNGSTSNCITVNTAGIYSVTITGSNGCTSSCSQTVSVNTPPVCNITGTPSICGGQPTQLCATPGQSAYLWNNGSTSNCITVNTAGIYSVTITGSNGCTSSCSQTVSVNTPPVCNITGTPSICGGQSTQLCATPGQSAYLWGNGSTSNCITVNTAGIYSVTITGSNGCTSSCSQTVSVNPSPVCTITGTPSFCPGQSTQLCATPGQSAYLWSNGSTSNCITVNIAGIYSVTITGSNGCTSSCSQTVSVNTPPVCNITGVPSICGGQPTQLCATPGQSAYLWSNGSTSNCITVSLAGTYSVTITGPNGCSSNCSQLVTGNPPPVPVGYCFQSFCADASPTIASLVPNGPGILWYNVATGGVPLAAGTPLVNGGNYYASQTTGTCESTTRLHVMVGVVTPAPGHICIGGCEAGN